MTQGEFVSEVRHHIKALNKDERVSARYILATAKSYIQYLINNRAQANIFRDIGSFIYVPCIEMTLQDKITCDVAEFRMCDKVMKSKKELPKIYSTTSGPIIESVSNIDNSVVYERINSLSDYTKTKKRKFAKEFKGYALINNYLYLVGSTSESVNINFLPEDERKALELSACGECDKCAPALNNKFICPDQFLSTVRDQTVQLIVGTNKRIPEDERPDLDSNQKQ